ncbi:MAG: exodeoxyribonuclease VII large subunit [Chloroflexota bacterium]
MATDKADQRRTIPQTNALIRSLVEQEMLDHPFWVGGIVTHYYLSDFGHIYFDLIDDGCAISCMLREKIRGTLDFIISNEIEIEVYGTVRVFEKKAQIQIEIEKARLIERPPFVIDATVQEQLAQKGLWPKPKRPLPKHIKTIGLVTSKQSDALHDFEDTYRSENGTASVKLADVRLQGEQAAREIADAITRLNHEKRVDIIAIIRGGGRASELLTFNDMGIAEAVCRSTIPVLTGIGHQRDHTIADELADVSTITPTAAASYVARLSQSDMETKQPVPTPPQTKYVYVIAALVAVLAVVVTLLVMQALH